MYSLSSTENLNLDSDSRASKTTIDASSQNSNDLQQAVPKAGRTPKPLNTSTRLMTPDAHSPRHFTPPLTYTSAHATNTNCSLKSHPETSDQEVPTPNSDRRQLEMILPDRNGLPMKQAPVSGKILQKSSLLQLFNVFCSTCPRTEDEVTQLTFRFNWNPNTSVVINKTDDIEAWEDLKEEIMDSFQMAKVEMPERRRFHVFVKDTSGQV